MLLRATIIALASVAVVQGAALAQSTDVAPSGPDTGDSVENLPQKIHDELTSQGFKDVKVVPGSFVVSAKNKDGQPVVMLIGPGSMTMLTGTPSDDDSTAEGKHDNRQDNQMFQ